MVPVELPFKRFISLDYYDGPIEGFTICTVCHSTFYFKTIHYDADENVKFCRILVFSKIELDFDEKYEYFEKEYHFHVQELMKLGKTLFRKKYHFHVEELKRLTKSFNEDKDICKHFSAPITNICIADDSFHHGLWSAFDKSLFDANGITPEAVKVFNSLFGRL